MISLETMQSREKFKGTMLGDAIRALRTQKGWSINQLADISKVEKSTISRLESGARRSAHDGTLKALANVFDVPFDMLQALGRTSPAWIAQAVTDRLSGVLTISDADEAEPSASEQASVALPIIDLERLVSQLPPSCDVSNYERLERLTLQLIRNLARNNRDAVKARNWSSIGQFAIGLLQTDESDSSNPELG